MAISIHVARVGLLNALSDGTIVSKQNSSVAQVMRSTSGPRVIEDEDNPNTSGNPTVSEYLEAEAEDGFMLQYMDQNSIVTYSSPNIGATNTIATSAPVDPIDTSGANVTTSPATLAGFNILNLAAEQVIVAFFDSLAGDIPDFTVADPIFTIVVEAGSPFANNIFNFVFPIFASTAVSVFAGKSADPTMDPTALKGTIWTF